jgi:hypothetical protein
MNKNWTGDAAFMPVLKGLLNRAGLIVMLFVMCTILYTDPGIAGSGGNPNKVVSSNKGIPGGSGSNGVVGIWGYPGVAGPGGYPGVAGYGGYYPSWRHTQSKRYSGIAGNKGYPGISAGKGYPGISAGKGSPGIVGNKSFPGISAAEGIVPGVSADEGVVPGIDGD